jgi:group I intron endonuclease
VVGEVTMFGRIYLITNIVNGKKYIGQTIKTIEKRLKEHFKAVFVENRQVIIYNAIRKYGEDNFSIMCLQDNIAIDDLDTEEQYWIWSHI